MAICGLSPCCVPGEPLLEGRRRFGPASLPAHARAPTLTAGHVASKMETHVASEATTIAKGGGLADRYAAALYAHADDAGALDTVVAEMESLGALIDASADFRRLIESPLIDVTTGTKAALAVLEQQGFGKPVRDFVGVISANRRLRALREIVAAFAALVADRRGIITAHVAVGASAERSAAATIARPPDRGRLRQRQYPWSRSSRICSAAWSSGSAPAFTIPV